MYFFCAVALYQLADTRWPTCPFEQGRQCVALSLSARFLPNTSFRHGAAAAALFSPTSFPPSLFSSTFNRWLPPLM